MRIRKHICFRADESPMLVDYLNKNQIPFERGGIVSNFDIYEDDAHWDFISAYIKRNHLFCLSETEYTKRELCSAQWLRMRSQWRFGYPQPESNFNYEDITYTRKDCCPKCNCGLKQINPFRIKKAPKWGQRHFAELNWVGDELFLDNTAETVLKQEGITGVSFLDVCNKKGDEIYPDIRQLQVESVLDLGLQTDRARIREIAHCPECGITKYVTSGIGMLSFRREIFENQPDIVKSGEYFGSGHYAARVILIRQKVYETILRNKLDRGLVFEPIELV